MSILFFKLMIGHAFSDFVFQSDWMAKHKNPNCKIDERLSGRQSIQIIWPYVLTAHALVNGGIVYIITDNLNFGFFEFVIHWMLDFGKCKNWYGVHADQSAHILCKLLWSVL